MLLDRVFEIVKGMCRVLFFMVHPIYDSTTLGRNKHFVVSSIKDFFENVEAQNIIDFIKETRFYKQL